ncbi:MAG: ATP-dependent zinc metalloprotease FtsH [Desulfatiglandales bacterium]
MVSKERPSGPKWSPPQIRSPWNWKYLLLALALSWVLGSLLFAPGSQRNRMKIPYSAFKERIRGGSISEVTLEGRKVTGTFKKPVTGEPQKGLFGESTPTYEGFSTVIPVIEDPELMPLLREKEVTIQAESDERSWFSTLLLNLLPWILIIGFFVYSGKKLQERAGGGGGIFSFGKSKAKLYTKSMSDVTFEDVAGLANAKKELQEVVDYLKNPFRFRSLGGDLPRGILLVGPPGVGKTLMARAVAGEAEVPFYSISGSEFIEMFVGVGASRVRDMFMKAKNDAPAIIFIDELDSIGRVRGTGLGGGHDEREQTLNQILSEMDGFSTQESVMVISATNRPDVLDPALVRPGRFDRRIMLDLPQKKARKEILEVHTRDMPLADDVDLENTAKRTVGFSGAELKNLANEAALLAARRQKKEVEAEDFDDARDKILMGIEREDIIKDEEKRMIAFHEAGHALVARFLPDTDPLEKVSIIPRGQSLGATEQIPAEDRHNLRRTYLLNRVTIMLGGRAAEQLMFEDVTTGAGDDLKKASELARRMVCQWGMSEKLGPVTFRRGDSHPFLGREIAESRDFSDETAHIIDLEIQKIVTDMEKKARRILESNRNRLEQLAEALLEHETLDREEIDAILDPKGEQPGDKQEDVTPQ